MATPQAADGEVAVRAEGLQHAFGEGAARFPVLQELSFSLAAGEVAVLTGPSGSGKTTFLTLVGALRSVQEGSLKVLGREFLGMTPTGMVEVRQRIGFIFQHHNLFESLSALQNVVLALDLLPLGTAEKRARAQSILEELGLGERLHAKPEALSGGQRQRVAVARAVAGQPRLILADEPTAALDKDSGRQVVGKLRELAREEGAAILIVTHDNRILDAADRVLGMVDGRLVSDVRVARSLEICRFLAKVELFSQHSPATLSEIAEEMEQEAHGPGVEVVRQGEAGDRFYVVRSGSLDVRIAEDGKEEMVRTLESGDFFGEVALLEDQPRTATVVTRENTELYTLSREDFLRAVEASKSFEDQLRDALFTRR